MSYEEDIKINKYKLDEELVKQPQLYLHWAEQHAEAVAERDEKRVELDLIRAEIDGNIRESPEDWGYDKKPSEAAITNLILQESKYRDVQSELIEATKNVNIMSAAMTAMNDKKKALEGLVTLLVAGIYSEPKVPREKRDKLTSEEERKTRSKGRDKLNRKLKGE